MSSEFISPTKATAPKGEADQQTEKGASMSPPAFQLRADPVSQSPVQRKGDQTSPQGEEMHEHEEEINPGGDFSWDAMVIGGDANLQKTQSSDASETIKTFPKGAIVEVWAERGAYYYVISGMDSGFVEKSSLQQLSYRLSRQEILMDVLRGTKTIKAGDSNSGVTVMQQLFSEYATVIEFAIFGKKMVEIVPSGTMDAMTVDVLKAVQKALKIAETGEIDQATVSKANEMLIANAFQLEGLELKTLAGLPDAPEGVEYTAATTPKELLADTHNISANDQTAFEAAINTEAKDPGGVDPTFKPKVGGKKYGDRIKEALKEAIVGQYDEMAKGMQDKRKDPTNLHDWGQIEKVAKESKGAADQQFGKYRVGPPLLSTGIDAKIKDAWEHKEQLLKDDPSVADGWVEWRVDKLLNGDDGIKAIDELHGAVQSRAKEASIIAPIKKKLMKKYRKELIEIHKAWPAFSSGGTVFTQRFKEKNGDGTDNKEKGREYMWDQFQTIIHEYIHSLEHTDHVTHREAMDEQKGGFTLREGTTDYFTKVAYNNTDKSSQTLRDAVEGPFAEPGVKHPLPNLYTYGESQNAEAAAGIIGFPNMCAAFFLGRVDLYRHT